MVLSTSLIHMELPTDRVHVYIEVKCFSRRAQVPNKCSTIPGLLFSKIGHFYFHCMIVQMPNLILFFLSHNRIRKNMVQNVTMISIETFTYVVDSLFAEIQCSHLDKCTQLCGL